MRLFVGALVATASFALLFACATDHSFSADESDAGPSPEAALPDGAAPEAAAPLDAGEEYEIPDATVACDTDGDPCVVRLVGAAGTYCAVRSDGKISCWGNNDNGQLGYDSGTDIFPPSSGTARVVPGVANVAAIAVGDGNTCVRSADGGVYCWGNPDLVNAGITAVDGGVPFDTAVMTPTRETAVNADPSAPSIVSVGSHSACVGAPGGGLSCWGNNALMELGRGATVDPIVPPGAANLGGQAIAAARLVIGRSFAITTSATLYSWGSATAFGSTAFLLGRDTSEDPDGVPALVAGLTNVRIATSGNLHSCAIAGRWVECWGSNDSGQLGRGTFGDAPQLPGLTRVGFVVEAEDIDGGATTTKDVAIDLGLGDTHSCVAMGSGRVYCWGGNGGGQLGSLDVDQSGYPTKIRDLEGVVGLAAGRDTTCALLRSGVVQCWGANYEGDLGQGTIDGDAHPHPVTVHFLP